MLWLKVEKQKAMSYHKSERRRESGAYLQSLVTIQLPMLPRKPSLLDPAALYQRALCLTVYHLQSIVLQTMASLKPASHMPLHVKEKPFQYG